MVNAHLLAVTNAGTSSVNASTAGCKNCPGSSGPGETPSFATLLNTQTNESSLLSDQPPAENDLANVLIAAPPPPPETLPAALLALAANDALTNDALLVGDQAVTDDIAPAPSKPEPLLGDLIAKPANPEGKSQPLPNFAENLQAIAGRIDPHTITGPNNIAGSGDQPVTVPANPAGTIVASATVGSPAVIIAQDNLAQPTAPTNQSPEALLNPASLPIVSNAPVATDQAPITSGENAVAKSALTTTNLQPQPLLDTPLVLNDNARSPTPVAEQVVAKTNIGPNDAQLTRPTLETEVKAGSVATKPNGEAAPGPQNTVAAQTNPREAAALNAGTTDKAPANTGAPLIEAPAPAKIERNAPTDSSAAALNASSEGEARPASLIQRLKPLAQAAFSFQGMKSAQNSAKTLDGMVPAISMTTIGDLARPSGITGLAPTSNNPALPPVPLNNIAVHIASQASAGHQRFNIRLDPPELGRIDIRLEIGRDGSTMTHLAVEKPETLDLLRQDARTLERALNNAGLDSRNGSLSFSLKDDNQNKQTGSSQSDEMPGTDENHSEQEGDEPVINRTLNMSSGLDISI